jgi:hypothetical protein
VLAVRSERTCRDALPIRGETTSQALEERSEQSSKRQRDEHIKELADAFDAREPDLIPF